MVLELKWFWSKNGFGVKWFWSKNGFEVKNGFGVKMVLE
jgi:hypothetical protein